MSAQQAGFSYSVDHLAQDVALCQAVGAAAAVQYCIFAAEGIYLFTEHPLELVVDGACCIVHSLAINNQRRWFLFWHSVPVVGKNRKMSVHTHFLSVGIDGFVTGDVFVHLFRYGGIVAHYNEYRWGCEEVGGSFVVLTQALIVLFVVACELRQRHTEQFGQARSLLDFVACLFPFCFGGFAGTTLSFLGQL